MNIVTAHVANSVASTCDSAIAPSSPLTLAAPSLARSSLLTQRSLSMRIAGSYNDSINSNEALRPPTPPESPRRASSPAIFALMPSPPSIPPTPPAPIETSPRLIILDPIKRLSKSSFMQPESPLSEAPSVPEDDPVQPDADANTEASLPAPIVTSAAATTVPNGAMPAVIDNGDAEAANDTDTTTPSTTPRSSMELSSRSGSPVMRKKSGNLLSSLSAAPAAVTIAGTEYRVEARKSPPVFSRKSFFRRVGFGSNASEQPRPSSAGEQFANASSGDRNSWIIRQGKKMFTVYKIVVKCEGRKYTVHKRYSEFDSLDKHLKDEFPLIHKNMPELPPKRYIWDNLNPDFIDQRARGLHRYIQQIFLSPVLLRSQGVREFLCGGQNISNITSPVADPSQTLKSLDQIEHSEDEDDDDGDDNGETQSPGTSSDEAKVSLSRSGKPTACFTTVPESTESSGLIRPALKKSNSLKRTLKKVAWRKTIFEIKDTPQEGSPKNESPEAKSSPFSSMLYPFNQHHQPASTSTATSTSNASTATTPGAKSANEDRSPSSSTSTNVDVRHSPSVVGLQDFYLLKLIGKGNFGKVMLAQHKDIHQVFAIKVISKSSVKRKSQQRPGDGSKPAGSSPHDIDHIMAERNVLIRSVRHPFLIGLRWAFQTSEKLYFVTDYVNGGELFFHLQRERRFSELRARFYTAEIVSALEYLHVEVDVVYRDLKPENILLDAAGHIKLTDFGLAKENFHERNRGRTQTFCGTPEYLAPEVLRKEPYGFPVDWWCLGAVLYEMLVGLPPFYSKDTQEMYSRILYEKLRFPPYVSVRARSIISGLLQRSAHFRLGSGPNNTSNPGAVKMHPFFEGLDWDKLYQKEYPPPFTPTVSHMYDLRNIDPTFVNEPIPQSVLEDSVLNAEVEVNANVVPAESETFKGFTFMGEDDWLQKADSDE